MRMHLTWTSLASWPGRFFSPLIELSAGSAKLLPQTWDRQCRKTLTQTLTQTHTSTKAVLPFWLLHLWLCLCIAFYILHVHLYLYLYLHAYLCAHPKSPKVFSHCFAFSELYPAAAAIATAAAAAVAARVILAICRHKFYVLEWYSIICYAAIRGAYPRVTAVTVYKLLYREWLSAGLAQIIQVNECKRRKS